MGITANLTFSSLKQKINYLYNSKNINRIKTEIEFEKEVKNFEELN